ncbi:MAG: response regulator, partial [Bacteroidetes bacterium]
FDEFKQANSEIHSRYGGTGLGLAISQQLVELMGGTISVRSTIGKGSIFYFSIPFEIGKEDEHATASTPANLSDKTILLVEDDKMNQFVAQKMLDTTGVAIQIATNGLEATEMALAQKFDLILMDIQMPVMNGFEATQRIRNEGKNTSTPIIALTADVQGETKTKALEAGMNDLLTKPFHKMTLIETITSYLS